MLRFFWDGIPLLFWLGLLAFAFRKIGGLLQVPSELSIPLALFSVGVVMWAMRPVRKYAMLHCYSLMLRQPIKPIIELAIWKLLIVHDRYWPAELPNYLGTTIFTDAFRTRSAHAAMRITRILWRAEYVGKPHIAKPARGFLREVNAPLRPEWETSALL